MLSSLDFVPYELHRRDNVLYVLRVLLPNCRPNHLNRFCRRLCMRRAFEPVENVLMKEEDGDGESNGNHSHYHLHQNESTLIETH